MKWLKTDYPFEQSSKEKWNTILILSFILALLLFILQPYGFSPLLKAKSLMGYSVIGAITLIINYFNLPRFFPRLFEDRQWSIVKALVFFLFNFLIIGCWIHVFNSYILRNDVETLISGYELFLTLIKTMVIGIIASSFLILIRYNVITRKHLQLSQDLNHDLQSRFDLHKNVVSPEELLSIEIENKIIKLPVTNLIFISAEGNYLSLHLLNDIQNISKLYRGRIMDLEQQLKSYGQFFRCHRSFIVNTDHIISTKGNSQGLTISFRNNEEVPIARSRIKLFKKLISQKVQ